MKKAMVAATALALLAVGAVATAPGATAGTVTTTIAPSAVNMSWESSAWADMQRLAPVGSRALGRSTTLTQIQRTCNYLNSGIPASDVLDAYQAIEKKSAVNRQQYQDMFIYDITLTLVAAKRLCPRHINQVWSAINR